MNKITKILGIALAILLMAGTWAAVASKPSIIRSSGESAFADFQEALPDGVMHNTYVSVWEADKMTSGYVSDTFYDWNNGYYKAEYGHFNFNAELLNIDGQKLNEASVIIPEVQLGTDVCDPATWECKYVPTRTIKNLEIQWKGTGMVYDGVYSYKSKDNFYFFKSSADSVSRNAIATGSADGQKLGITDNANVGIFKSATFEKPSKQK